MSCGGRYTGSLKKKHNDLHRRSRKTVSQGTCSEHSPGLENKSRDGHFVLDADIEDQVSEVLAEEYKGISFGGIKGFGLYGSPVNLLPKMRIGEDCEVERYNLSAFSERDKFQKCSEKRIEA
ncbi:MAG: uncharacterized protein A8A55_2073 [Amphiamblys sp. WSBS2006]|nr:MAG: uncharacterized protein A8A55_2073 [Amphiamblys sp. WSBS2006]